MEKINRYAVSERGLLARINRKLEDENRAVKKARGRAAQDLGEFYLLDYNTSVIVAKNIDLEDFAKKMGVLNKWEFLDTREA